MRWIGLCLLCLSTVACSTVSPVVDRITGTTIEQRCEKDYRPALAFWTATAQTRTLSSAEQFAKQSVETMVATYCIPKPEALTPPAEAQPTAPVVSPPVPVVPSVAPTPIAPTPIPTS